MHCDPSKDEAVSSLALLLIAIQPFLKWYQDIYLLGSSEGKRLSRTLGSDDTSELSLSADYELQASLPGPAYSRRRRRARWSITCGT